MIEKNNIIAILTEPYKFELIVKNMPFVQDEYVLVEYLYCGICGGDYSAYCGYRQTYPISLGHEFIAKVISVGDSVKTIMQGQYVVSDFNFRCGSCVYCDSKQSHLCMKNDIGLFSNRGFSKYATIQTSSSILRFCFVSKFLYLVCPLSVHMLFCVCVCFKNLFIFN